MSGDSELRFEFAGGAVAERAGCHGVDLADTVELHPNEICRTGIGSSKIR